MQEGQSRKFMVDNALLVHKCIHCRKAKAIEFMVVDALLEADQTLKLSEKIHDPADFVHLNDSILETVGSDFCAHTLWCVAWLRYA